MLVLSARQKGTQPRRLTVPVITWFTRLADTSTRSKMVSARALVLTEDDVIGTVCLHLAQNRHRIVSKCATKDCGIDIVAEHSEFGRILIEAKGETSARKTSKRDRL